MICSGPLKAVKKIMGCIGPKNAENEGSNAMGRKIALVLLPLLYVVLSGCTTPMQKYWLNNQFHQSAQYFEKNQSMEKSELDDLYLYCISLFEIKNYEKFNACHDTFFARAQNAGTINRTSRDAILAEIHSFKARNMIDLGADRDDVKREIDYSLALLKKAPENFHNGYKIAQIHIYETAGIYAAVTRDRSAALDYIGKIKDVTSMAEFQLRPIKNAAVAGIYFVLKDYAQAKKVIEEYSGSAFFEFAKAVSVVTVFPLLVHYADVGTDTRLDAWTTRGTILSEFMAAKILFETGQYAEAKKGYETLLSQKAAENYERLHWTLLADLASIYRHEGHVRKSIAYYEQAINIIENQRRTIFSEGSRIGFVGDKQAVYHDLIAALHEDRQYEKAFEYVERAKSRALVDLLASKKDFAANRANEKEISELLTSNDAADLQIALPGLSPDRAKTRSIQIRVREALKSKAPELAALVTVNYLPFPELVSHIASGETLVEYYYRDKAIYCFVLANGRLQTLKLDGEGLAEDVQSFRKLIDTPGSDGFMVSSQKLYKRLFEPLESLLQNRNLIIVAHGVLHYLPMNALHDGNGYLIDRFTMRMMPSASALKYLKAKSPVAADSVLVFGNPDLGDPKYDLRYAQQEAMEVARIHPHSKVFLRKEATEAALRANGRDYRYLHFATHGRFDPELPLKSALLLAADAGHTGLLSVDKLYTLNLNADLVTLSACETGLSRVAGGDDLVGLTRGFLYAGSGSVIASLWKVDDLATSELMARFYIELRGKSKADALRSAQLETKKKYPHPYYWASFQLTGNAK